MVLSRHRGAKLATTAEFPKHNPPVSETSRDHSWQCEALWEQDLGRSVRMNRSGHMGLYLALLCNV